MKKKREMKMFVSNLLETLGYEISEMESSSSISRNNSKKVQNVKQHYR